jgi:hypothetical protein
MVASRHDKENWFVRPIDGSTLVNQQPNMNVAEHESLASSQEMNAIQYAQARNVWRYPGGVGKAQLLGR